MSGPNLPVTLRNSAVHWLELKTLLNLLENAFEACARLDAHRRVHKVRDTNGLLMLDRRFDRLRARLDIEISRVTVERLDAERARKQRRALAWPADRDALDQPADRRIA